MTVPIFNSVKIKQQKLCVSFVKRKLASGKKKVYAQHRLQIPKRFVDKHGDRVYLLIDAKQGVGIFVSDEKTFSAVLKKFPEIHINRMT